MVGISIIVPIYNAERSLANCINSVINQTYKDWELLLIDDGSTDNSPVICDNYAKKISKIKVIHILNGGVSNARNIGISHAKGEWVTFLDSDDYISNDYLYSCCKGNDNKSNLVILPVYTVKSGISKELSDNYPTIEQIKITDLSNDIADFILEFGVTVAKVYNRRIIVENHIRFDTKISSHEDHLFYLDYLKYVESFCFRHFSRYNYILEETNNASSLSRNLQNSSSYIYSYNQLSMRCGLLAKKWNVDILKLPRIQNFLQYVKIKSVRSAFYYKESKGKKLKYLNNLSRKEIVIYYKAHSMNSFILKIILLMPNVFRMILLDVLHQKLRK